MWREWSGGGYTRFSSEHWLRNFCLSPYHLGYLPPPSFLTSDGTQRHGSADDRSLRSREALVSPQLIFTRLYLGQDRDWREANCKYSNPQCIKNAHPS